VTGRLLAAALLLAAPAFAAEVKGPVHLTGIDADVAESRADAQADAHEALADARQDIAAARSAVDDISRDHARIAAGDWSGVLTIEGDKIVKCGDPSKYPDLDCKPYSAAEKAEMLAGQAEDLAEARTDLVTAEADLASAEAALKAP